MLFIYTEDKMAERPEDLNLPTAVITRIIKEAVSTLKKPNLKDHAAVKFIFCF